MKINDKLLILRAIKKHYDLKSDGQLADHLGIRQTALSNWYSRNYLNWETIFTACEDLDFDILIREGIAVPHGERPDIDTQNESVDTPIDNVTEEIDKINERNEKIIERLENILDRQDLEIERLNKLIDSLRKDQPERPL